MIVRYADDIVVGFEHEADAVRFREALTARLASFSLALHPEKTRLIQFGRHAAAARARLGLGKPETFTFLGFTFVCGRSLRGRFLLLRLTRRDCMVAKLKAAGIRAEADLRNEKINYKVREHSLAKVPLLLVVGNREAEEGTLAIRRLGSDEHQKVMTLDAALAMIADEAVPPDLRAAG